MPSYVMLFHFTHEGIEHVKQSPDRVDKIRKLFHQNGGKVKDFYLMMGQYDSVFIAEAPDDETIARIALLIEAQGNVRSETHRAFSEAEFRKIVSGLPCLPSVISPGSSKLPFGKRHRFGYPFVPAMGRCQVTGGKAV